jgi:hypothetical protein
VGLVRKPHRTRMVIRVSKVCRPLHLPFLLLCGIPATVLLPSI